MRNALAHHWPEYAMEAAGLAAFMVSACLFTTALELPTSPLVGLVPEATLRRGLIGLAMGATAVSVIYSPWGKQSGAHLNPSVTLAFLRLGKVKPWDAAFYVVAQFVGGLAGVLFARMLLGPALASPQVNYAITTPGPGGAALAFGAELAISFVLMTTVLTVSSGPWAEATGLFAAVLVTAYIFFEAPYSGMSMNPARTLGSAIPARTWTALWVYFTAPPLGMLLAAEAHRRLSGRAPCAKLHHENRRRCIFCNREADDAQRAAA